MTSLVTANVMVNVTACDGVTVSVTSALTDPCPSFAVAVPRRQRLGRLPGRHWHGRLRTSGGVLRMCRRLRQQAVVSDAATHHYESLPRLILFTIAVNTIMNRVQNSRSLSSSEVTSLLCRVLAGYLTKIYTGPTHHSRVRCPTPPPPL